MSKADPGKAKGNRLDGLYPSCREKIVKLRSLLSNFGKVGIAFSGGADSSFLLHTALEVLGPDKVRPLYARSCLQKKEEQEAAAFWLRRHGYAPEEVTLRSFDVRPLARESFVRNTPDRCYLCKHRVYSLFLAALREEGIPFLLDGTNSDDAEQGEQERPGLRVITELGVRTPLADSGLYKSEIRELSREAGLDTFDLPSSSCLATRLPFGVKITRERLERIAGLERIVTELGFAGCRVRQDRVSENVVFVQLLHSDMPRFDVSTTGRELAALLKDRGVDKIFLDLDGR